MPLKYGRSEMSTMVEALEGDYETVEDAAQAVLLAAESVFRKRAKFVVVGQLTASAERLEIPSSDPEAIKLCLDWYSTEGDARKAGESLWSNVQGDRFRVWTLPMVHETPAELHGKRRDQYVAQEEKRREAQRVRIEKDIEKDKQESEDRAHGKGSCECGHQPYDHRPAGQTLRGLCAMPDCECPKFNERKWTP